MSDNKEKHNNGHSVDPHNHDNDYILLRVLIT